MRLPADLPPVDVDAALIVQVFANLLDNAAKYTPPGTRVQIAAAVDGPYVRVTVDDDGPGLPRGDPARLFDKFQRGAREATIVGVGLGLAICRAIVERTAARSRRTPRRTRRALRVHAADRGFGVTQAMHQVLVVEDEPDIRHVLRVLLESERYRVVEAATAQRADIEARSHKPDLLIVDLGLPDGDGLEVIRRVRAWSPVPIIVLSARTLESQKIAALDAGADDYVTKPFSAGELLARVRAALRRSVRRLAEAETVRVGAVQVDLVRREARGPLGDVHLTPLEFRLLEVLMRNSGMIVRQPQLLREVWGPDRTGDARSLRVCIKNIREKLEPDPRRPRHVVTEVGLGYRFRA